MKLALSIVLCAVALASSANAVPPPPQRPSNLLKLKPDGCPLEVSGSVHPYSPETYRFTGKAGDILVMVSGRPDLNLMFSLGLADESPLVEDAGFGPDVRVRLPQSGTYDLGVSGFDPVAKKAVSIDYSLRLYLRGPTDRPCPTAP